GVFIGLIIFTGFLSVDETVAQISTSTQIVQVSGQWENLDSGNRVAVLLGDNEMSGAIPIPFSFKFFHDLPSMEAHSALYISSNGFITFEEGQSDGCPTPGLPCSGQALPNSNGPNGLIAAYWEDLDPSVGGLISYGTVGAAPNRKFIVEFDQVPHAPAGNPVSFQIQLLEGSNEIEIYCLSCPSDGGNHTQGIETISGQNALCFGDCDPPAARNSTDFSLTDDAIRFSMGSSVASIGIKGFSSPQNLYEKLRYKFHVEQQDHGLLFSWTSVRNRNGGSELIYNLLLPNGFVYDDPTCYADFLKPPNLFVPLPDDGPVLSVGVQDYDSNLIFLSWGCWGQKHLIPMLFPGPTARVPSMAR
ncbi:MAG TPA: hypothetical protein VIU33_03505, partial [Nitrospiria bacterium]